MTTTESPSSTAPPPPPQAERRDTTTTRFDETFVDPWAWLRDKDDPAVIAHLEAENAHTDAYLEPLAPLQERLFEEIRSRVQETDESVRNRRGEWWYSTRTEEGLQYGIHLRRHGSPDAEPEVWLDGNALAEGHEHFRIGGIAITPEQDVAAYLVDTTGDEVFELRLRDLASGEDLDDVVTDVSYGLAWCNDGRTLLYTRQNEQMRPFQVWRHVVGTSQDDDELLFTEDDERFFLSIGKTRSDRFVVLALASAITTEAWLYPADDPAGVFGLVEPRVDGIEYDVDDGGDDHLWITTNADDATDFKLCRADVRSPGRASWVDVVPHREGVKLEGVEAFRGLLVAFERAEAATRMVLLHLDDDGGIARREVVDQPEEVSVASPGYNHDMDVEVLRYAYESLVTPPTVYDLDLSTGDTALVKRKPVPGYDVDDYVAERHWATSADGTRVPISLVRRADTTPSPDTPCLLYGYGSYEVPLDPHFSSVVLSLLDRGFVFAVGHPRGGGEMGRRWYEDGKLEHKQHTFDDFVACADHLVEAGMTSPKRLAIRGGSAGGLLMGAVTNQRPDLFAAVIAEVPFVDVLTTMSDPSLPLTVIEWEEWGNPTEEAGFRTMRAYSPYDNVPETALPRMFVTAGLNDPRVGFWEPAKWVQRLREAQQGDAPILLRVELGSGHAGRSGRYDAWREEAEVLAWLVDALDAPRAPVTAQTS